MQSPTSWSRYHKKILRSKKVIHPKLNAFATRYALAKSLPDFEFGDFSKSVSHAYFVSLKIAFSYTALESLEIAIGGKNGIKITQAKLADQFRSKSFDKFFSTILSAREVDSKTKDSINAFLSGKSDDLRAVVYAVRNLMFHGTLTATALNLTSSKARRDAMDDLAECVLHSVDARFTNYVSRMN